MIGLRRRRFSPRGWPLSRRRILGPQSARAVGGIYIIRENRERPELPQRSELFLNPFHLLLTTFGPHCGLFKSTIYVRCVRLYPICFRTPALALSNHFAHVFHRTNLEWPGLQTGMIRYQPDGVVHIPGLKEKEPTDLFFGFGVRAVHDDHFVVSKSECLGVPDSLESFSSWDLLAVLAKYIVVFQAFVHKSLLLAFGHRCPRLLVEVTKTNVFHDPSNVRSNR